MTARCSFDTEPWWARAMTGGGALALAGLGHHLRGGAASGGRACRGPGHLDRLDVRGRPLRRDLVEPGRQPLGQPSGVGEDDRRGVLLDQVDDALLDVRPDAARYGRRPRWRRAPVMSSTGTTTSRSQRFSDAGATTSTGAAPPRKRATSSTGRTVADRPDALGRPVEQRVEALERQREVGAALGAGDGVHLVEDHGLDAAQRLACLRGEHQEQRLGRGDQDVRRAGLQLAPVAGGGVSRAHPDADLRDLEPQPLGGVPDAGQRRPEVALDVDRERLERGDVEDPAPLGLLRRPRLAWPAGRSTTGTPRASCPSRSAPPPARAARRRSPPTRRPGRPWARRTPPRTRCGSGRRSRPGTLPPRHPPSPHRHP